jgi:hypothetical protein
MKHCCKEMTNALLNSPDKYHYCPKGDVYTDIDGLGSWHPIIKYCGWCGKKLPNDLKKRMAANPSAYDSTGFLEFVDSLRQEFTPKKKSK